MNHLSSVNKLKNRYFAMRHGESMANIRGIILSHPRSGVRAFGLSDLGKKQAEASARAATRLDKSTVIYSSDFKRAMETGEILRKVLKARQVNPTPLLRERFFGNFERASHVNYEKVWLDDKKDPHNKNYGVESPFEVMDRTTRLVARLERMYSGRKIVLVAHGDALQILQVGFVKESPSSHRKMKHLNVAEIRELKLKKGN